jgi:hypothetical protein
MASMAPTDGGQYHWVSEFCSPRHQKFLSYVTGKPLWYYSTHKKLRGRMIELISLWKYRLDVSTSMASRNRVWVISYGHFDSRLDHSPQPRLHCSGLAGYLACVLNGFSNLFVQCVCIGADACHEQSSDAFSYYIVGCHLDHALGYGSSPVSSGCFCHRLEEHRRVADYGRQCHGRADFGYLWLSEYVFLLPT